jgi:hypothetical protein
MIILTEGSLNNSYINLGNHLGFFPADAVGAANVRDGVGAMLTVHFDGLPDSVETDIAGPPHKFSGAVLPSGGSSFTMTSSRARRSRSRNYPTTSTASCPSAEQRCEAEICDSARRVTNKVSAFLVSADVAEYDTVGVHRAIIRGPASLDVCSPMMLPALV